MNDNDEGEFYIHAFSNADTEKNKDNTLTSFINNLPLNQRQAHALLMDVRNLTDDQPDPKVE